LLSATNQKQPHNKPFDVMGNRIHRQQIPMLPPIHQEYWTFTVISTLGVPFILSYEDTLALPTVDATCALVCSNIGIPQINNVHWRGISLQMLLECLNIRADFARFHSADGYITSLPLTYLDNALLAHEMNGEPLSHEHGFPMRLVVPGYYGHKMPKWLTRLELTDTVPVNFLQTHGPSTGGRIEDKVVILRPYHRENISGTVTIRGIAYANEQNPYLEVSSDDGLWMPVPFTPAPPFCISEWEIDWSPPAPGDYLLKARTRNGGPSTHQVIFTVLEM
jgi:hypothetical protein